MKKIVWEHLNYKTNHSEQILEQESDYDDETGDLDEYEDEFQRVIKIAKTGTLVNTPYGLFNIKDALNPMKQFVFWMGHANFDVTEEIINNIALTPGVEKLRPISRYRFIIAVGKAFDFTDVRKDIEQQLLIESTEVIVSDEVDKV